MKITIGTRGSNLSLTQTNWVKEELLKKNPDLKIELKVIHTTGDKILDKAIHKIGDKGVFIKEIEKELLSGDIDLAVHSMKDMPGVLVPGLVLANPPAAEIPNDVLVSNKKINSISDMENFVFGTGSIRRSMQLKRLLNCKTELVRGNIETRMKKIETQNLDGVVLAAAGLLRAGYKDRISYVFNVDEMIPSPCQGILALEYNENDLKIKEILESIEDEKTTARANIERAFLKELNTDCKSPVGIFANIQGNSVKISACFGDAEKNILLSEVAVVDLKNAEIFAINLAKNFKEKLCQDL